MEPVQFSHLKDRISTDELFGRSAFSLPWSPYVCVMKMGNETL